MLIVARLSLENAHVNLRRGRKRAHHRGGAVNARPRMLIKGDDVAGDVQESACYRRRHADSSEGGMHSLPPSPPAAESLRQHPEFHVAAESTAGRRLEIACRKAISRQLSPAVDARWFILPNSGNLTADGNRLSSLYLLRPQ